MVSASCDIPNCGLSAKGFDIPIKGRDGKFHDFKLCPEHKQIMIENLMKWIIIEGMPFYKNKLMMQ
jgi:hypothetical protein